MIAWGIARASLAGKYSPGIQHDKIHTVKTSYGIMHNVIIWLYKPGWNAMHVSRWIAPDGTEYVLSNLNCPSHRVVFAIVDSYNAIELKHAAKHRNGKGMENGIDFNSLFQFKKCNYSKNNYQLLSAFETAVVGHAGPTKESTMHPKVCRLFALDAVTQLKLTSTRYGSAFVVI